MSTSTPLPSSRTFLTSIVNTLATQAKDISPPSNTNEDPTTPNPLKDAPPQLRSLLMTLHLLYPNELLPALDVLDRNLVTRLCLKDTTHQEASPPTMKNEIYLVRSAQQHSNHPYRQRQGRFIDANATATKWYEVRLNSWNCSCPAFTFAAFPSSCPPSPPSPGTSTIREGEWSFGGLGLGEAAPVCKHLLACVLEERCQGLFGGRVEVREVGREEFAGWCAGWGG